VKRYVKMTEKATVFLIDAFLGEFIKEIINQKEKKKKKLKDTKI